MSHHVVGVEGTLRTDAVVVWGAAAIRTPDRWIINSHSGARTSEIDARRLAAEGHLIWLRNEIEIRDEHATEPLLVVMVNRQAPQRDTFLVEAGKTAGVLAHTYTKEWLISVFANRVAFDAHAATVAERVAGEVLYSDAPSSEPNRNLIRMALSLSPGNATLNAIRVFQSGSEGGALYRVARASIRPTSAVDSFESLLQALRSDASADYEIKYEGGVSREGGFDVDVASETLGAIERAIKELVPAIKHLFPFLREVPYPRFDHMVPASAEMHFKPAVEGRPVGERVARYMSLVLLQRTLRGEKIEVPRPQSLQAAVNQIVNPTPDTRVLQKPLAAIDREEVVRNLDLSAEAETFETMDVLGFISGLQKDYWIEVSVGRDLRKKLSTKNDGSGETPRGAEVVFSQGDRFLRKPCIASIFSYLDEDGKESVYLKQLRILDAGVSDRVTAIPSSVVKGAYLTRLMLLVRVSDDGVLQTPIGEWSDALTGNLGDARSWLVAYSDASADFELTQAGQGKWLRVIDPPAPLAVQRILVALASFNGRARIPELLVEINRRFKANVRINNTRREVRENDDLLKLDDADDQVIRWTEAGHAHYRIYLAAGGKTSLGKD